MWRICGVRVNFSNSKNCRCLQQIPVGSYRRAWPFFGSNAIAAFLNLTAILQISLRHSPRPCESDRKCLTHVRTYKIIHIPKPSSLPYSRLPIMRRKWNPATFIKRSLVSLQAKNKAVDPGLKEHRDDRMDSGPKALPE